MGAVNTTRTSTGIEIGGAYIPPPPQPSADAERIQAALLNPHRTGPRALRRFARALARWLCSPSPWETTR